MPRDSCFALRVGACWLLGCAGAVALLVADGCATQRATVRPRSLQGAQGVLLRVEPPPLVLRAEGTSAAAKTPPPPISPFLDSPVSVLIHGHFTRGEQVIVRVCLRPDHSIASSDLIESSGDRQFDQLALTWAQRVRQRESAPEGRLVAPCGAVRVELHDAALPPVVGDHADQLG